MDDLKKVTLAMIGTIFSIFILGLVDNMTLSKRNMSIDVCGFFFWYLLFPILLFLLAIKLAKGKGEKVIPWIMLGINIFILFLCISASFFMSVPTPPATTPNIVNLLPSLAVASVPPVMFTTNVFYFLNKKRFVILMLILSMIYIAILGAIGIAI